MTSYLKRTDDPGEGQTPEVDAVAAILSTIDTLKMNEQEREEMEKFFWLQRGAPIATSIMQCTHTDCPYHKRCPLFKMGKTQALAEAAADCPVELGMIILWVEEYMNQLKPGQEDATTLALIKSVASYNLEKWRTSTMMSTGQLMVSEVRATTPQGGVITELAIHPLLRYALELDKRKQSVLKELLATPDARDKAKRGGMDETTAKIEEVKALMTAASKRLEEEPNRKAIGVTDEMIDASYEIHGELYDPEKKKEPPPEDGRYKPPPPPEE